MKRIIVMLLIAMATAVSASAQFKLGELTIDIVCDIDGETWSYEKGDVLYYSEDGKGKVTLYDDISRGEENDGVFTRLGNYAASNIKFNGFYEGEVTDPKDDHVNIRKGPGTNHPVVKIQWVGSRVRYKTTSSNWLEVYEQTHGGFTPIGFIYKDRVKTPTDIN